MSESIDDYIRCVIHRKRRQSGGKMSSHDGDVVVDIVEGMVRVRVYDDRLVADFMLGEAWALKLARALVGLPTPEITLTMESVLEELAQLPADRRLAIEEAMRQNGH